MTNFGVKPVINSDFWLGTVFDMAFLLRYLPWPKRRSLETSWTLALKRMATFFLPYRHSSGISV
jgi:hypothetical protein